MCWENFFIFSTWVKNIAVFVIVVEERETDIRALWKLINKPRFLDLSELLSHVYLPRLSTFLHFKQHLQIQHYFFCMFIFFLR